MKTYIVVAAWCRFSGRQRGKPKARRHVCTLPVGGGEVFEIEFEALVKSVDTFLQASEILVKCLLQARR
jgi:hypothetical protein